MITSKAYVIEFNSTAIDVTVDEDSLRVRLADLRAAVGPETVHEQVPRQLQPEGQQHDQGDETLHPPTTRPIRWRR